MLKFGIAAWGLPIDPLEDEALFSPFTIPEEQRGRISSIFSYPLARTFNDNVKTANMLK